MVIFIGFAIIGLICFAPLLIDTGNKLKNNIQSRLSQRRLVKEKNKPTQNKYLKQKEQIFDLNQYFRRDGISDHAKIIDELNDTFEFMYLFLLDAKNKRGKKLEERLVSLMDDSVNKTSKLKKLNQIHTASRTNKMKSRIRTLQEEITDDISNSLKVIDDDIEEVFMNNKAASDKDMVTELDTNLKRAKTLDESIETKLRAFDREYDTSGI